MTDAWRFWARPGGLLLRRVLPVWRAKLPQRLSKTLDAFVAAELPVLVDRLDNWIEDHQSRIEGRVLDALRPLDSATLRELQPTVGGTLLEIRKALHGHVRARDVAWADGRYHILLPGGRTRPGYHGLRTVAGLDDIDRRISEILSQASDAVSADEIWLDTPGSARDLLLALHRRRDVGLELRDNEPFYFLESRESAVTGSGG